MPELPEVEVVRLGLEKFAVGRPISAVTVYHDRPLRRHVAGPRDFADRLRGRRMLAAHRRGKYLWLPLDSAGPDEAARSDEAEPADEALIAHLGMSGQFLVQSADLPDERQLRVRFAFADGQEELRYVDQRMFGGLMLGHLVDADEGSSRSGEATTGPHPPREIAHIAPDPLDPAFDDETFAARLRRRRTGIKRALLDQSLISGVGNIYADEALWRARMHYDRPTEKLRRPDVTRLLGALRDVMGEALAAGGTSFDSLYVNVNGESGYFERALGVYGREGQPCDRCGTPIRRAPFMNRSSHFCPACQRKR